MTYNEACEAIPNGYYQHFKGGIYKVIYIAEHSESGEAMVIYQDNHNKIWARPADMWNERVGCKRFELLQTYSGGWKMIIKNIIKCKYCGDVLESTPAHEFKQCSCLKVAVDGGHEYLRRCYPGDATPEEAYEELSECIPDKEE